MSCENVYALQFEQLTGFDMKAGEGWHCLSLKVEICF